MVGSLYFGVKSHVSIGQKVSFKETCIVWGGFRVCPRFLANKGSGLALIVTQVGTQALTKNDARLPHSC